MISLKSITEKSVFIIAEIGNNHNGSRQTAIDLIEIAANAGVNAVKFQTFMGRDIVSPLVKANEYADWEVGGFDFWYEFLDTLALPLEDHKEVFDYARKRGLIPFSTPTSDKIVDFLESIDNEIYKIASMDVNNIQLLRKVALTHKPVILSTGMATDDEIQTAIDIFSNNELAILHCVSDYPTRPEKANLLALSHIAESYGVITGLSDHSLSNAFAIGAVALGGRVIEKHITYSRNAVEKAEHHFALEPDELTKLVIDIRNLEKGLGAKALVRSESELGNKQKYRRGLHLNKSKRAGETINGSDISVVRPVIGATASEYEFFLGKILKRNVDAWTGLRKEDLYQ
jgi:N,N'-diacetyllegionaminate synthase